MLLPVRPRHLGRRKAAKALQTAIRVDAVYAERCGRMFHRTRLRVLALNQPPTASPPVSSPPPAAERGDWPSEIAGFAIKRLLGEGGMGRVFLAQQAEPHRDVALKVMRSLDPQSLARFRREAELLAALEHPGIARLYASGETEFAGMHLPWLAMEYIQGKDLLSYAESHGLGLEARLRLLIGICRAVHFAHARGVIHRDLKPGNILVDDDGRPRVLDFGIARMIAEGQTMTQAGQVLGTLPYMSPEQLGGSERQVDIRTDVYALGVIAYELIARRLPYPRLSTGTLIEALDIVRNETPPRLSSLSAQARGDLDWVVMKALASEPERRYSSAAEFAADLERVLDHRPVEARPPTLRYLAGRFIRRNRVLSGAVAVILLVLMGATVVSLRYALAEATARQLAEQRAAEAQAVSDFLQTMLTSADPENARGEEISLREVLDQSARGLLRDDLPPAVANRMRLVTAEVYLRLGQPEQAEQLIAPLLPQAQRGAPAATSETSGSIDSGVALQAQMLAASALAAKGEVPTAIERYSALASAHADAAPELAFSLQVDFAELLSKGGKHDQAAEVLTAAMAGVVGESTIPKSKVLAAKGKLAAVQYQQGKFAESVQLAEQVLSEQIALLGDDHPDSLASLNHLAAAYQANGQAELAEQSARKVLELRRKVLGERHPAVLDSQRNLAVIMIQSGRGEAAVPLLEEVISGWQELRGLDAQPRLSAIQVLAYVLVDQDQLTRAEALLREAAAIIDAQGGAKEINPLSISNELAMLLMKQDRLQEAEQEFARLLRWSAPLLAENDLYLAIFRGNLGECHHRLGKMQEARASLEASWAVLLQVLGSQHARAQKVGLRLVEVYLALGLRERAEQLDLLMKKPAEAEAS